MRNPWHRFASAWNNRVLEYNQFNFSPDQLATFSDFSAFIAAFETMPNLRNNLHFKPQVKLIDLNHIDFLGRFETFQQDLETIFRRLNIPTDDFPHKNKAVKKPADIYTHELRSRVYDLYKLDFQIFYPKVHP